MAGAVTLSLGLPDVYLQRRRRAAVPARVRTDVAGFVGFESRLRPLAATLTGATVALEPIELRVGDNRSRLAGGELVLSEGPPPAAGASVVFAVVAVLGAAPSTGRLPVSSPLVIAGTVGVGVTPAPDDAAVGTAVGAGREWTRLADVQLRRDAAGLWLTVHPRTGPIACEDWTDYMLQFGEPRDDGTRLAAAVRAFFANGGDRCHVATVRRPFAVDDTELDAARRDMIGVVDSGVRRATGIARLLLLEEPALVAAPDLHALRPAEERIEVAPGPSAADAGFSQCGPPEPPLAPATGTVTFDEPLYADLDVQFATQLTMLELVADAGLGVQLALTPPRHRDPVSGRFAPPDAAAAKAWRRRFPTDRDRVLSHGALYWPWLRTQAGAGAAVVDEPPLGTVLGIVARRDLERGPFVAPANEPARAVIATTHVVGDADHRDLYDASGPPTGRAVNVLRPFPTRGIELWGSRTLAADRCLRHLPVRRGLSAIERNAAALLADVAFEPNTPLLAIRVTHALSTLLLRLFDAGALRGATPAQAFVVRCDDSVNPPESVLAGRLVCEVAVALAAPAEFVVFRLAVRDQAIEVLEP